MVAELTLRYGTKINRTQLLEVAKNYDINPGWLCQYKLGWGLYDIAPFASNTTPTTTSTVPSGAAYPLHASAVEVMPNPVAAPALVNGSTVSHNNDTLSEQEIMLSQRRRFRTLDRMARGVVDGTVRSMIVSGPAGIGKTYTIESILEKAAEEQDIKFTPVKGFVKATGIYKLLFENKNENNIILLDDADSAFYDDVSLNILKAALDSSKRRIISWRSEKVFETADGDCIPNSFEFKGSIIFVTNLNFEQMISQGSKLSPHLSALISRSYYIDLNFSNAKEYLVRIKDVLMNTDMAHTMGLDENQAEALMTFVEKNYMRLRELSLRMVLKLSKIMLFAEDESDFMDVVETTCFIK